MLDNMLQRCKSLYPVPSSTPSKVLPFFQIICNLCPDQLRQVHTAFSLRRKGFADDDADVRLADAEASLFMIRWVLTSVTGTMGAPLFCASFSEPGLKGSR